MVMVCTMIVSWAGGYDGQGELSVEYRVQHVPKSRPLQHVLLAEKLTFGLKSGHIDWSSFDQGIVVP